MSRLHILLAPWQTLALLLSILCVDLTICCILLATICETSNLLVLFVVSVSLKLLSILLAIYKSHYRDESAGRAKGIIGDQINPEKSISLDNRITGIVYLLIVLVSLAQISILMTRPAGPAFAAASCIMAILGWVFDSSLLPQQPHLGTFNPDMASDSSIKVGVTVISRWKIVVPFLLQVTPMLSHNIALWFLFLASLGACFGVPMQPRGVIEIYCLEGIVLIAGGICWKLGWPLKSVFGFSLPIRWSHMLIHAIIITLALFCTGHYKAHFGVFVGLLLTHMAVFFIISVLSRRPEYKSIEDQLTESEPSEDQLTESEPIEDQLTESEPIEDHLKVVTTGSNYWLLPFTVFILLAMGFMTMEELGMSAKDFDSFATALNQVCQKDVCGQILAQTDQKDQCVMIFDQMALKDHQCTEFLERFLLDFNQFVNSLDASGQKDQCAKPTDPPGALGHNYQSVKTYSQYHRTDEHVKAILNSLTQVGEKAVYYFGKKAFNRFKAAFHRFDNNDPFVKAFDSFVKSFNQLRQNGQCVKTLEQSVKALNGIGQNNKCVTGLSEFVPALLDFVEVFNLFELYYWCSLGCIGALIAIFLLGLVYGKIPILKEHVRLRRKFVTFGKKILEHTWDPIKVAGEWLLGVQFPMFYLIGMFLYRKSATSRNCPTIAVRILCIVLLFVLGYTDAVGQLVDDNPDPDGIPLVLIERSPDSPSANTHNRARTSGPNPYGPITPDAPDPDSPESSKPSVSTPDKVVDVVSQAGSSLPDKSHTTELPTRNTCKE